MAVGEGRADGPDALARVRDRRLGLWTTAADSLPLAQLRDVAGELDELGYGSLWFGEAYGRESLTTALTLLNATEQTVIGTGITNIYARGPMAAAGGARLLEAAAPGRFIFGLGVSHRPLVERDRRLPYGSPIETMRGYLDGMATAPYLGSDPDLPPLVLAALGPVMLRLARERTAGAHPYLVTPEHTATAREILGPDALLAVMQAAVLGQDREETLRRAHEFLEWYTGLENYRNNWRRLGFDDSDLVRGGSERLADAMVVGGDESTVLQRVEDHLAAGADTVLLQVIGPGLGDAPIDEWRRLATAWRSSAS